MTRSGGVLYLQYTNPACYPPLEHSSRILAEAGWEVLFLGTGAFLAGHIEFPAHPRITVRRLRFCPAGWRQKLHYLGFCLWSLAWALRWRPRWIYASDPLACPPALLLSGLTGAALAYHEHDSPNPPSAGAAKASLFLRLCYRARTACARRAALCVLPNERRADRFAAETRIREKPRVVWNCPAREEVAAPRESGRPGGLRLLYHGSIVPDRLPVTVVEAMASLPSGVRLSIVGYETVGSLGHVDALRRRAEGLGLDGRLDILGTVATRGELLAICRRGDLGLCLLPGGSPDVNTRAMAGASNKPFDYLACGLPVLVPDLPDWREMFVEPGYALCCDPANPASIVAAVGWFYEHPSEMRAMGERGRQRILRDWNYEAQFRPVLELLTSSNGRRG